MMRRRLPLLLQGSVSEKSDATAYLTANTNQPSDSMKDLPDAIAAKGWLLGAKHDLEGFRELSADADHFLRCIASVEPGEVFEELVISSHASRIAASLGPAAEQLGLTEDAARLSEMEERLRDWTYGRRSREFRVDGKVYAGGVKTGRFPECDWKTCRISRSTRLS